MASQETQQDCYLITSTGACLGPLSVDQAAAHLAKDDDVSLILRAGFAPVPPRDLEGVALILNNRGRSLANEPSSQIPQASQDIFDGRWSFDVDATDHYRQHKAWFESHGIFGGLQRKESARVDRAPLSQDPSPSQSPTKRTKAKRAGRRAAAATLSSIVLMPVLILGAQELRQRWSKPSSSYDGFMLEDLSSPARGLTLSSRSDVGGTALGARTGLELEAVQRVAGARLAQDPKAYSRALLDSVPHHGLFPKGTLPSPGVVASFALSFLDADERMGHPSWSPLLQLVGAEGSRQGLMGLASAVGQIQELTGALFHGQIPPYAFLLHNRYSRSDTAVDLGAHPERAYWGSGSPAAVSEAQHQEGSLRALKLFASVPQRVQEFGTTPDPTVDQAAWALRRLLTTRALWQMLTWAAARSDGSMAAETMRVAQDFWSDLLPIDSEIARLLEREAATPWSRVELAARVAARMAALARMQQTSGFLCRPEESILGQEFLLQTMRMAILAHGTLPEWSSVWGNCWIHSSLSPLDAQGSTTPGVQVWFKFAPMGPDPRGQEAQQWPAHVEAYVAKSKVLESEGDRQKFRWVAATVLAGPDSVWRRRVLGTILSLEPTCAAGPSGPAEVAADPVCWGLLWEGKPDVTFAQRGTVLDGVASAYGRSVAQRVLWQGLVGLYLGNFAEAETGQVPLVAPMDLLRKHNMVSYVEPGDVSWRALGWYFAKRFAP